MIENYNPAWPAIFEAERQDLDSLLAPRRFLIEHIGSTSVPGLAAKPIIDVMLGCDQLEEFELDIPLLICAGWQYLPEHEADFPNRRFLAKPDTRPRRFHLHAVEQQTDFWRHHILFRDRLRENADTAAEYEALKLSLALRFGDDREAYTDAKSTFIKSVLGDVS